MRIFPFQKKGDATSRSIITSILVSVLFGLFAGLVGMLIVMAYIVPPTQFSGSVFSFQTGRSARSTDAIVQLPVSVSTAHRSAVTFYEVGPQSGRLHMRSYLPKDAVGAGMVLTSDGWLISHEAVFTKEVVGSLSGYVAAIGSRVYDITDLVRDPHTGIVLLKVDGTNLPVTVFDDDVSAFTGDAAFAFDATGGALQLQVVAHDDLPATSQEMLIHSSESIQNVLRLSFASEEILPGSMVMGGDGQVFGVFVGSAAVGAYAIPFAAFEGQVGEILRERRSVRPYLGVHYLDLSRLVGVRDTSERLRGALLVSDDGGEMDAVLKHSPAEISGLHEGDLIIAVNDEELTANKAFSDLIAEYAPGAIVTLTLRPSFTEHMDGPDEEVRIDVELGAKQ